MEPKDHSITLNLRLAVPTSAGAAAQVEQALSDLLRMLCAPASD